MFEDVDEELDLITEQESEGTSLDSDEEEARRGGGISVSKVCISTLLQVCSHLFKCKSWLACTLMQLFPFVY